MTSSQIVASRHLDRNRHRDRDRMALLLVTESRWLLDFDSDPDFYYSNKMQSGLFAKPSTLNKPVPIARETNP